MTGDLAACAELVKARDPARYRAAQIAPAPLRDALLVLYAFNAEIVHAAWSAREPALAEIRLQYWHDQVEALFAGRSTDHHPVLDALSRADWLQWQAGSDFLTLIAARRWDVRREPFPDTDALWAYLRATGGTLMAMGARVMRMKDHYDGAIRDYGQAAALAAFFVAVPGLKAHGRKPLPDEAPEALHALAQEALEKMEATRKMRLMRAALPVLLSASEARPVLKRVVRQPELVLSGGLERAPFRQRLRMLVNDVSGRW